MTSMVVHGFCSRCCHTIIDYYQQNDTLPYLEANKPNCAHHIVHKAKMTRIYAPFLFLLAATTLDSPLTTTAQLISVQVKPTEPKDAGGNDLATAEGNDNILSEAPSDTVAPSSEATSDNDQENTVGPAASEAGCDPMEQAFAPSCCPMTDPVFAEFCTALMGRPYYASTGMIEAHEPWIGGYGIASQINNGGRRAP